MVPDAGDAVDFAGCFAALPLSPEKRMHKKQRFLSCTM